MFKNFFLILSFAKKKRLYQLGLLFILTLISMGFEILSVGSLMPVVDILANTENLEKYKFIDNLFNKLNKGNYQYFYILLFVALIILSYVLKIILIWFSGYLTHTIGYEVDLQIFNKTVYKKYSYHTKTNSSSFIGNLEKADRFKSATSYIFQFLISSIMIAGFFVTFFYLDSKSILFFGGIALAMYLIIFLGLKKKFDQNSKIEALQIDERIKIMQETTMNIREVIVSNIQKNFLDLFKKSDNKLRKISIKNNVFMSIPGNLVVLVSILILLFVVFEFNTREGGVIGNLSIIGVLTFVLQKILPQAQFVYASLSKLRLHAYAIKDVKELLVSKQDNLIQINKTDLNFIEFKDHIKIINGEFKHEGSDINILQDVNIEIKKNSLVLIKGDTGSGKSTLVDIIIGLIKLNKGQLVIDNHEIDDEKVSLWQNKISHIPQQAGFLDASIERNITFLNKDIKYDEEKLIKVAKVAEAYNFIESKKEGFKTHIGEKGIKLSGGQRQRIALARALYSNKEILFLDEATNALNSEIEEKILDNISNKIENKTIIVISHRDKIINYFDTVYKVENKSVFKIK